MSEPVHPRGIISVQELRRSVGVPAISVAALAFDFRDTIFNDTVAATKNGPVRTDFIKARPQRWRILVGNNDVIDGRSGRFNPPNTVELRALEPCYCGFDCFDYARVGLFDVHQKLDNADTLMAA